MKDILTAAVVLGFAGCAGQSPEARTLSPRLKLCSEGAPAFNLTMKPGIDADSGLITMGDSQVRIAVDPYLDYPNLAELPISSLQTTRVTELAKRANDILLGYKLHDGRIVLVLLETEEGKVSSQLATRVSQSLRVCD